MYIPSKLNLIKLFYRYPLYLRYLIGRKMRFYKRYKLAHRGAAADDAVPMPLMFKLYLTLACDLRCKMCMFWGEGGVYAKGAPPPDHQELEWETLEGLFRQAGYYHPSFILSGGEPLMYSHFDRLASLLHKTRCFAYVCTNGMMLEKKLPRIQGNPYLVFYVSLDGTEQINDALRGKGVHEKVIRNIKKLKSLPHPPYVGVQFTLQPENVGVLYETCKEVVALGVDWVLINLRWYLSQEQADEYAAALKEEFKVTPRSQEGFIASYPLDTGEFIRQCEKIRQEKWPIQISSYLKEPQDIVTYMERPRENPYNNFCYKQWIRMDVLPSGDVTPCIQYPDLVFGNLKENGLMQIWNSPAYADFRKTVRKKLFSVCGRCYCLYLYDKGRIKL